MTLLLLALAGCVPEPTHPLTEPPVTDRPSVGATCDGFEWLHTRPTGGVGLTIAGMGDRILLNNETLVLELDHDLVLQRAHAFRGVPRGMAVDGQDLWVATDRGGLTRLAGLDRAEPTRTTWPVSGLLREVLLHADGVWVSDLTGRLLWWPRDATPSTEPQVLFLDAQLSDLTPWGDGVLVAGAYGGLRHVVHGPAGLEERPPPCERAPAYAARAHDDRVYIAAYGDLHACGPDVEVTDHIGSFVRGMRVRGPDDLLLAAGDAGLYRWRPGSEPVPLVPALPSRDVLVLDEDTLFLAADGLSVRKVVRGEDGWAPTDHTPLQGWIEVIRPTPIGLAVGMSTDEHTGFVRFLEPGTDAPLVGRGAPVKQPSALLPIGRELLVGQRTGGVVVIDLAAPEAAPVIVPDLRDPVVGLARTREGAVAVTRAPAVVWLERGPDGWAPTRRQTPTWLLKPDSAAGDPDEGLVIFGSGHGLAEHLPVDGAPRRHVASGASADYPLYARPLVRDGVAWIPTERGGLDRIDLTHGTRTTVDVDAHQVVSHGDELVLALGHEGVGALDPETGEITGRCALPGLIYRVEVGQGRVWAASPGALFELRRTD